METPVYSPGMRGPESGSLVLTFIALGKEFGLEYEGLHQICFKCGRYGQKSDGCPEIAKNATENSQNQATMTHQNGRNTNGAAAT
ncbi:hypothetical protein Ahy_A10g048700 [Arachis hypogaea]|uniref:CCHC-type domain-containing protein n=1 Tax=Arachis hypogaea TaxID=3818 RepID=A0A445B5U3_ARAHY|nr:hypothetical protein Ahy_A10g048700 [Arachis hypogaea]